MILKACSVLFAFFLTACNSSHPADEFVAIVPTGLTGMVTVVEWPDAYLLEGHSVYRSVAMDKHDQHILPLGEKWDLLQVRFQDGQGRTLRVYSDIADIPSTRSPSNGPSIIYIVSNDPPRRFIVGNDRNEVIELLTLE